jgi:hypothetical protein
MSHLLLSRNIEGTPARTGNLSIASLDVPVLSTGILSPFPTPGDNSSIAQSLAQGMHWNIQNNVWNVSATPRARLPPRDIGIPPRAPAPRSTDKCVPLN